MPRGTQELHSGADVRRRFTISNAKSAGAGRPLTPHGRVGAVNSADVRLLAIVRALHESNSSCCDCGDEEGVEWVSLNLLCVLCIKCSGMHRSLGSHISKVRSLTLDSLERDDEVYYIISNYVSNANVNSIFEARTPSRKIDKHSNDSERARYIRDKYSAKRYTISEPGFDIEMARKAMIKAVHLNSLYLLEMSIAHCPVSMKEISHYEQQHRIPVSLFYYSLKQTHMDNGKQLFYITEFLLLNGLLVDILPAKAIDLFPPEVLRYWKARLQIYESCSPLSIKTSNNTSNVTTLSTPEFWSPGASSAVSKLPQESSTGESDSLNQSKSPVTVAKNPLAKSSHNLMSPTYLLNMHKSFKIPKKDKRATNHN